SKRKLPFGSYAQKAATFRFEFQIEIAIRNLFVVDKFLHGDYFLLAVVLDGPGDGAILGGGADIVMIFAVPLLVEVIGDVLLHFFVFDDDDGCTIVRDA